MFGHEFKRKHFSHLDQEALLCNHGAYGVIPTCTLEKFQSEMLKDWSFPDKFITYDQRSDYVASRDAIAQVLNCLPKNLALIANATTGLNSVLRSIPFVKGDKIAMPTTAFKSCAAVVEFLSEFAGVEIVIIDLVLPLTDGDILRAFEEQFQAHKIKVAIFDAIVSLPAAKMPYEKLVALCRKYEVLSLVDGAHSVGILPLDFSAFKPDFFVSNLHKWFYTPRPSGVLYVSREHHKTIQPVPIGHDYYPGSDSNEKHDDLLLDKFAYVSSNNFAGIGSIPTTIEFRNKVCGGEDAIRDYCYNMARTVGVLGCKKWPGAALLENEEHSLTTAMVSFFFPLQNYSADFDIRQPGPFIHYVQDRLLRHHKTAISCREYHGRFVVRFSCQIYNELSDYERAMDAIHETVETFFKQKRE